MSKEEWSRQILDISSIQIGEVIDGMALDCFQHKISIPSLEDIAEQQLRLSEKKVSMLLELHQKIPISYCAPLGLSI